MTYHQITYEERYTVGLLRRRGLAPAAIARVLGRHQVPEVHRVERAAEDADLQRALVVSAGGGQARASPPACG